jgi:hypothetical protein
MAEVSATRVTSGKGLFSFAHVFKPTAIDEKSDPKYNTQFIWPKKDKATTAKFEAAIKAAESKYIKDHFGGKKPAKWATPIRDGDDEKPDDDVYANSYFIAAKSSRKPKVVDKNFNDIIDPDEFYSGCFGAVVINFYGYDVGANKGIGAGLESIMKLSGGEPLGGGGGNIREDFADFSDDEGDDLD